MFATVVVGLRTKALVVICWVLLCVGASASAASAAVTDLNFQGCVGDLSICTQTNPATALDKAHSEAVTPDGRNLYVGTLSATAVNRFTIGANGTPVFAGCFGNHSGCTQDALSAVGQATGLVVTPDGKNLYAATYNSNNVSHFTIGAGGVLTFDNCYGNHTGCTPTNPAAALDTVRWLTVSPDGTQLYAGVDYQGNNISHFTIGSDGNLTFDNCIGDLTTCTATTPAGALDFTWSVVESPDSKHLYAISHGGGTLSYLDVGSNGDLTFSGCVGETSGCTATNPSTALTQASSELLSNNSLYVTGAGPPGTLNQFTIDASGVPTFAGCVGDLSGCTAAPANTLDAARSLAVTPDNMHLYVGAFQGGAVSEYALGSGGAPSFMSCVGAPSACTSLGSAQPLNGVLPLLVSPDGTRLYAGSFNANNLSYFGPPVQGPPHPAPTCTLTPQGKRIFAATATAARHKRKKKKHPKGQLRLSARCDQAASLTLNGTVKAVLKKHKRKLGIVNAAKAHKHKKKHKTKTFKLRRVHASVGAGGTTTIVVKLTAAALAALKKGAHESVVFSLTATNANGAGHASAKINRLKLVKAKRKRLLSFRSPESKRPPRVDRQQCSV